MSFFFAGRLLTGWNAAAELHTWLKDHFVSLFECITLSQAGESSAVSPNSLRHFVSIKSGGFHFGTGEVKFRNGNRPLNWMEFAE